MALILGDQAAKDPAAAACPVTGSSSSSQDTLESAVKKKKKMGGFNLAESDARPSDLRNHRMGEYDSLFAGLYRIPGLISCLTLYRFLLTDRFLILIIFFKNK